MLLYVLVYKKLLYDPRFQNQKILGEVPSRVTVNLKQTLSPHVM